MSFKSKGEIKTHSGLREGSIAVSDSFTGENPIPLPQKVKGAH